MIVKITFCVTSMRDAVAYLTESTERSPAWDRKQSEGLTVGVIRPSEERIALLLHCISMRPPFYLKTEKIGNL